MELGVLLLFVLPMIQFYDKSGALTQLKEPRNHWKGKYIQRKYHSISKIVYMSDVTIENISSMKNLEDHFTKT